MDTVSSSCPKPGADLDALKIAVAVALLRTKQRRRQLSSSSCYSVFEEDAQRWKRKAKERKRELTALREELKQLEEGGKGLQQDILPLSCRCHFFDGFGTSLSARQVSAVGKENNDGCGTCDHLIDDVLRRRFLRHVRWKERQRSKRPDSAVRKRNCIDLNDDDEMERLSVSVDFLVELCGREFPNQLTSVFTSSSHQAVDSILVSLKKLQFLKKDDELIEELVYSLITRLLQRMCTLSKNEGSCASYPSSQFCVQHLLRKLSYEPFVCQRAMLLASQKIASLADSLTITDPFDDAFSNMHDSMFMMMQLFEFLICDNLQTWINHKELDSGMFEEWLRTILQTRKTIRVLDDRNGLYLIYLERIIGEVANQMELASVQGKDDLDILSSLLS